MPDIIPLDLPATYWRERGRQAQRVGSYPEAVRQYRAALRKHDDNAIRRDLAQTYADMHCLTASDRLYMENLARDAGDTDSLYGLARNRSLTGDENAMADLLDLYLRLAPCGEQADRARDILWQLPRGDEGRKRMRRAEARYRQALDAQEQPGRCLRLARQSWRRGKTSADARLLSQLYLRLGQKRPALRYAQAACRLAPEDPSCRQLLAAALKENDMPHGCRSALRQAAALCEGMEQLPLFCGSAICLGHADLAAELAERHLKEHPDSADLMLLLAMALREMPGQEERADALIAAAAELDEDNPMIPLLREAQRMDDAAEKQLGLVLSQLIRLQQTLPEQSGESSRQALHRELVRIMRMPLPGMADTAVRFFLSTGDTLGLRMALLENELPPMLCGLILSFLQDRGEPLPCFARVNGRLILMPQKPRPAYDADLQELIRTLLRRMPDGVTAEQITRRVPPLWRSLPESARLHCAQSRDSVWPTAFAVWLARDAGNAEAARELMHKCRCPRRVRRACMQLTRRSKTPYEVY